ncbi:MAG: hypothetical protein KF769_10785 [Parvibaculum sp.]|nr:hypothetical protein [Parvibaculum sp.]
MPWVSLFLAVSFAAYGYLKKTVRAGALEGLFVEVVILAPFGIGQIVTFGLIWVALALFSADTWVRERELRRAANLKNRG